MYPFHELQNPRVELLPVRFQALSPAGELIGFGGLVHVDLVDPGGPRTQALLPPGNAHRQKIGVLSIPGRRAVLLDVPGPVPGVSELYARALEPGAATLEQDRPGPPLSFTHAFELLSEDGASVAVRRQLSAYDEVSATALRIDPSDPSQLSSMPVEGHALIVDFGAHARELVVGHGVIDGLVGDDLLARHDVAAGQSRIVAQAQGGRQSISDVQRLPGGRLFFTLNEPAAVSRVLYVDDPGDSAPRALTPANRQLGSVFIAPGGDWLALSLVPHSGSRPEDLQILDERREWQPTALPAEVGMASHATFFANAAGEGAMLSLTRSPTGIHIVEREALQSPRLASPASRAGSTEVTSVRHSRLRASRRSRSRASRPRSTPTSCAHGAVLQASSRGRSRSAPGTGQPRTPIVALPSASSLSSGASQARSLPVERSHPSRSAAAWTATPSSFCASSLCAAESCTRFAKACSAPAASGMAATGILFSSITLPSMLTLTNITSRAAGS